AFRVEATEHAGDAEGVDLAADDGGGRPRAAAEVERVLERGALVGGGPDLFALLGVEGLHGLDVFAGLLDVEVDAVADDDGRAVALADGLPPQDLEGAFPGGDLLGRAAVAVRAEPLRPVRGGQGRTQDGQGDE